MLNRPSIDLEGKTVSVDLPNGGTFVTALTVVERLGIKANFVYIEQRIAMEKLKKGDLDAVIVVGGKPYVSVTTFNNDGHKVRDRDQSATQAAPPRHPPRRSHLARRALGRLIEQGAVTGCEHQGHHRDRADPDGCNRASEEAWGNPFPSATPPPGATQGISTTDHPSSDFPERQYVFR
jgi:hypothetical protein